MAPRRATIVNPFDGGSQTISVHTNVAGPPPEIKPPGPTSIGHGITDLSPKDQEDWLKTLSQKANSSNYVATLPAMQQQNTKFVRVPGVDYLSRGLMQAIEAEITSNGHYRPVLERIVSMGKTIASGLQTKDRMTGEGQSPSDIVVQQG